MAGSFVCILILKRDEMKSRVALVCITNPLSGGANSYEATILKKIGQTQDETTELVIFAPAHSSQAKSINNDAHSALITYKTRFIDLAILSIRSSLPGFQILRRIGMKYGRFERLLKRHRVDLVYFLSPNPIALDIIDTPMINTLWDLGHRDLPEFIEITGDRHYEERENFYRNVLPKSFRVVVDTPETAKSIERIYGVQSSKIEIAGIFFGDIPMLTPLPTSHPLFGKKFFLYPAQFWPHKNHVFLLRAFAKCLEHCDEVSLVFTGSDKGNLEHVKNTVESLGISKHVKFLGFVTEEELGQLLVSAHAVVFPSLLGPSNLPPLEALAVGTRSVISKVHSDAALINPLILTVPTFDVEDWAKYLVETYKQEKPKNQVQQIPQVDIEQLLREILRDFKQRREQWPS